MSGVGTWPFGSSVGLCNMKAPQRICENWMLIVGPSLSRGLQTVLGTTFAPLPKDFCWHLRNHRDRTKIETHAPQNPGWHDVTFEDFDSALSPQWSCNIAVGAWCGFSERLPWASYCQSGPQAEVGADVQLQLLQLQVVMFSHNEVHAAVIEASENQTKLEDLLAQNEALLFLAWGNWDNPQYPQRVNLHIFDMPIAMCSLLTCTPSTGGAHHVLQRLVWTLQLGGAETWASLGGYDSWLMKLIPENIPPNFLQASCRPVVGGWNFSKHLTSIKNIKQAPARTALGWPPWRTGGLFVLPRDQFLIFLNELLKERKGCGCKMPICKPLAFDSEANDWSPNTTGQPNSWRPWRARWFWCRPSWETQSDRIARCQCQYTDWCFVNGVERPKVECNLLG